ncbi:MAG: cytochrome c biogenesis protein ResB, partial [Phormidesmis sp.]
ARKIGFAITHWGLVVIIAGSAAVIHLSVEGMLLARTDGGTVSTLRVEGDLVEVAAPGEDIQQTSLFIKADGTVVPNRIGSLSLLGYSDHTMKTVRFEPGGSVENPAVRLVLKSDRMNQSLERWLAAAPTAYSQLDIGPAELQIVKAQTAEALSMALTAPTEDAERARWGALAIAWSGESYSIDVAPSLRQPVEFKANGKTLTVEVSGFWPDFRLNGDRQPVTATQQLNNPAVQLTVSVGDLTERWFVFGNPGFEAIRSPAVGEPIAVDIDYAVAAIAQPDAFFRVVVDTSGDLHYAAKSSQGFTSGPLAVGESVTPGWADFEITLAEYIAQAQVMRETVPLPEGSPGQGEPALLVAANKGDTQGQPVWIPWGEPTTLSSSEGDWYVAFSPKLLQLPFSLKLNDFIVERNEGSESVAMWTSAVSLLDPHTAERVDRRVWMNHPTWFKGWKIAQASWNPGDLSQSTLQVKREPWWVTGLTWLGSLMVTVGVATMFYGRSVAKKFKKVTNLVNVPEPVEEETVSIPLLNVFSGR